MYNTQALYQCLENTVTTTAAGKWIKLFSVTNTSPYAIELYIAKGSEIFIDALAADSDPSAFDGCIRYAKNSSTTITDLKLKKYDSDGISTYYLSSGNIPSGTEFSVRKEIKYGSFVDLLSAEEAAKTDAASNESAAITGASSNFLLNDNLNVGNITPKASGFSIGSSGVPFANGYFSNLYTNKLFPNGSDKAIGASDNPFTSGFVTTLNTNKIVSTGTSSSIGNSDTRFPNGYFTNGYITTLDTTTENAGTINLSTGMLSSTSSNHPDIGSATNYFNNGYFNVVLPVTASSTIGASDNSFSNGFFKTLTVDTLTVSTSVYGMKALTFGTGRVKKVSDSTYVNCYDGSFSATIIPYVLTLTDADGVTQTYNPFSGTDVAFTADHVALANKVKNALSWKTSESSTETNLSSGDSYDGSAAKSIFLRKFTVNGSGSNPSTSGTSAYDPLGDVSQSVTINHVSGATKVDNDLTIKSDDNTAETGNSVFNGSSANSFYLRTLKIDVPTNSAASITYDPLKTTAGAQSITISRVQSAGNADNASKTTGTLGISEAEYGTSASNPTLPLSFNGSANANLYIRPLTFTLPYKDSTKTAETFTYSPLGNAAQSKEISRVKEAETADSLSHNITLWGNSLGITDSMTGDISVTGNLANVGSISRIAGNGTYDVGTEENRFDVVYSNESNSKYNIIASDSASADTVSKIYLNGAYLAFQNIVNGVLGYYTGLECGSIVLGRSTDTITFGDGSGSLSLTNYTGKSATAGTADSANKLNNGLSIKYSTGTTTTGSFTFTGESARSISNTSDGSSASPLTVCTTAGFTMAGNIVMASPYSIDMTGGGFLNLGSSGYISSTSDARLKNIISSAENMAWIDDFVSKVKVYDYEFKNSGIRKLGIMAQDAEKAIPSEYAGQFVHTTDESANGGLKDQKSICESDLVFILLEKIRRQQEEINSLKSDVSAIKKALGL